MILIKRTEYCKFFENPHGFIMTVMLTGDDLGRGNKALRINYSFIHGRFQSCQDTAEVGPQPSGFVAGRLDALRARESRVRWIGTSISAHSILTAMELY